MIGNDGQIQRVLERRLIDMGFRDEVDRKAMPGGQNDDLYDSRSRESEIEAGVCHTCRPENCSQRHASLT